MSQGDTIITISDVLEYVFCPRFIYYMYCLAIPQHEESRFKVIKGREVHDEKRITNTEYLRKKLGVVKKEINIFIASKNHHIKGIVDEVLFLDDGTAAPFEYKYAEFKDTIFQTYKFQLVLHAMMIKENYNIDVKKGSSVSQEAIIILKRLFLQKKTSRKASRSLMKSLKLLIKAFIRESPNIRISASIAVTVTSVCDFLVFIYQSIILQQEI